MTYTRLPTGEPTLCKPSILFYVSPVVIPPSPPMSFLRNCTSSVESQPQPHPLRCKSTDHGNFRCRITRHPLLGQRSSLRWPAFHHLSLDRGFLIGYQVDVRFECLISRQTDGDFALSRGHQQRSPEPAQSSPGPDNQTAY